METIRWNMSPAEIEQESFRRIEAECDLHRTLSAPHWRVARRLIHTTADMHIADTLVFRHDPVAAGLTALVWLAALPGLRAHDASPSHLLREGAS